MLNEAALYIHLVAFAVVAGSTVWVFFIQSPFLFQYLGREKFVPIMIRLVGVFFQTTSIALLVMSLTSIYIFRDTSSLEVASILFAFWASLLNQFVIVPKATRAGWQSQKYRRGKDSTPGSSATNFTVDGGAGFVQEDEPSDTEKKSLSDKVKFLHRTVTIFVLLAAGGVLTHLFALVSRHVHVSLAN
eukprot:Nk52_evm13s1073 gene=Nk52_evmTU13s1073